MFRDLEVMENSRQVPPGELLWKLFNLATRWVKVENVGRAFGSESDLQMSL